MRPVDCDISFYGSCIGHMTTRGHFVTVLSHVKLSIPQGQRVGVCGRSGSGKSTLVMAIAGLSHEEEPGTIKVGNVSLDWLAKGVVKAVPQDASILRGSVRFNIDPRDIFTDEDIAEIYSNLGIDVPDLEADSGLFFVTFLSIRM